MRDTRPGGSLHPPTLVGAGLSAAPDFGFAATCLLTWVWPDALGDRMVRHIVMVMLLEFFVVHSAGFMGVVAWGGGSRRTRGLGILGLAALYTLFTAGYAVGFGSWWMVGAFWSLTLNRLTSVLFGVAPSEDRTLLLGVSWAASVVFYLASVFATVALDVPPLGITPDVVARQGFTVGGAWTEEPWRVVACGALYFFAQGCFEIVTGVWFGWRERPR